MTRSSGACASTLPAGAKIRAAASVRSAIAGAVVLEMVLFTVSSACPWHGDLWRHTSRRGAGATMIVAPLAQVFASCGSADRYYKGWSGRAIVRHMWATGL